VQVPPPTPVLSWENVFQDSGSRHGRRPGANGLLTAAVPQRRFRAISVRASQDLVRSLAFELALRSVNESTSPLDRIGRFDPGHNIYAIVRGTLQIEEAAQQRCKLRTVRRSFLEKIGRLAVILTTCYRPEYLRTTVGIPARIFGDGFSFGI